MTLAVDLSGRVALVTGASGGLGSHFARTLAANGAAVALAARRSDRLRTLEGEIAGAGGRALAVEMDVTDAESVRRAFEAVEAALGTVDILVAGSGIAGRGGRLLDIGERDFTEVIEVNLHGVFRTACEAARRMVAAGRPGSIVVVASIIAFGTAPGVAAYGASKAGVVHLVRSMAIEWARFSIRVNAIAPGYIPTDLNREFLASPAGQRIRERIPMRRFGEPADLDGALLLLASDASRYMTGTVVTVDGGHLVAPL